MSQQIEEKKYSAATAAKFAGGTLLASLPFLPALNSGGPREPGDAKIGSDSEPQPGGKRTLAQRLFGIYPDAYDVSAQDAIDTTEQIAPGRKELLAAALSLLIVLARCQAYRAIPLRKLLSTSSPTLTSSI